MNRENGLIIEGYASVFEREYLVREKKTEALYQEWEIIDHDAFRYCDFSQGKLLIDHEGEALAAVEAGTLEINADWYGLHFLADLATTRAGRALYDDIYQGFIFRASMRFGPNKEADKITWETPEKKICRVKEILWLHDIAPLSPGNSPCNPETCVFPIRGIQWAVRTRELEKLQALARKRNEIRELLHGQEGQASER